MNYNRGQNKMEPQIAIKDEAAQTPKRTILDLGKGGRHEVEVEVEVEDNVDTEERKSQPRFQGLSVHSREGKARYVRFQFQSPF